MKENAEAEKSHYRSAGNVIQKGGKADGRRKATPIRGTDRTLRMQGTSRKDEKIIY